METRGRRRPDSQEDMTLIACLSAQEAIAGSDKPLKPGYSYLLCFGEPFDRLVVRAVVCFSHLMPGERRRYEIGLFIPDSRVGQKLAELDRQSAEPLVLLGYPKLLGVADNFDLTTVSSEIAALTAYGKIRPPARH
jgi:hypothetical protein